jgi:voltage-gated potassium channel
MNDQHPSATRHVTAFQAALLIFTLIVLCALVVDTVSVLPKEISDLIHMLDTLACVVFFVDFSIRFYQADSKLAFMKWGWIDLIACIPNIEIMRWGRLVRVLRIIRLLRGIRSVQKAVAIIFQNKMHGGVVSVVFSALLLIGFSSVSVLICERQANLANIQSAEDAIWWSIATITTVGYGDKFPVTTEGRAIGIVLMVAGVSMFGCLSGLAASFFLGTGQKQHSETIAIMAKLDQLQAKIDAIARNTEQRGQGCAAPGPSVPQDVSAMRQGPDPAVLPAV